MLFYKTGSCATEAAAMIARHYSGKKKMLSSGYHGWHPWCSCEDDSFIDFEYSLNKLESYIKRFKDDVAAVFLTPECHYFNEGYYQELESICLNNNILFILDEVKTGFRVGLSGFQGRYSIAPDLSVYSKAISNGYSTGKGKILQSSYELHTAGTYDTEVVPFAAALATISVLESNSYLDKIDLLGQWFVQELNKIFETSKLDIHTIWAGGNFRFWIRNKALDRRFYEASAENWLLFYPFDNSYLSASHDKETLLLSLDKMKKIAHEKLSLFAGEYSEFKEIDLTQNLNLKGFLDNYPGKNGRSYE